MKWFYTFLFITAVMSTPYAQDNTPVIKRYSKIHLDKKYIISETIFADGHIDSYITSVPLNDLRTLRSNKNVVNTTNINWDEDASQEGLQITLANVEAIQNAFNNAIANTEEQLKMRDGSFNRITLGPEFLNLKEEIQSQILLEKVVDAFSSSHAFNKSNPIEIACAKELNDAIFLTNGEYDVTLPHIQAIYNWVFADQYTGWYNRNLILSGDFKTDKSSNQSYGDVVNSIISNPTFGSFSAITLHASDNKDIKMAMDISHSDINTEIVTPLISGDL